MRSPNPPIQHAIKNPTVGKHRQGKRTASATNSRLFGWIYDISNFVGKI